MPRENKKRGRRGQTKRKHDEVVAANTADGEGESAKRVRLHEETTAEEDFLAQNRDYEPLDGDAGPADDPYPATSSAPAEKVFYGMLDEEEQEYFRKTDEMLELDSFADPAERALFLDNIYREADGKELKMACSQSCSRLMEKLIHLSNPAQLSKLFQKFNGHFLNLVQHRFASHCCERLFSRAAPIVTEELLKRPNEIQTTSEDDIYVPMENLFLHTIAELEGNIGFLMTDSFASHALRLLLLILAGEPLTSSTNKSLLQSKKKEKVVTNGISEANDLHLDQSRTVPKSFTEALEKLMADCVAGLHTQGLRTLALHPTGSPILQVLMRLELTHFGKSRAREPTSILRTLLPDDPISQGTESAGFINGLNYDPIGSHLLEVIIEHTPGKMFKHLYKEFWKDRLASLSRSEIAAFLVCKILERISRDDLVDAHELIVPVIPDLIEKNRVLVVKTLMQRCAVRNVDTQAVAVAIDTHFQGEDGFDVLKLLRLDKNELEQRYAARQKNKQTNGTSDHDGEDTVTNHNQNTASASRGQPADPNTISEEPSRLQGSILAQAMVLVAGPLSGLIFDAMPTLPPNILFEMAADPVTSRTLQATMTSTNASIIPRRKLVQQFYGKIGEMALDKSASHVVDAIWEGTHGLAFIRERIAEELAENEPALRESPCGRAVWKNWKMDLYKRRRQEWVFQSRNKASNDGFQSFEELDKNKKRMEGEQAQSSVQVTLSNAVKEAVEGTERKKTPLEKARERHAAQKKSRTERSARASSSKGGKPGKPGGGGSATGANATASV
ncbi:putative nucleolar protein 9 [Myriangium duriaei CBS 260.36]|uniref:Nucleolar protein 9 n=1 Tax=Myriangium duriaei CBS 260.36 TaxID=1168546 RepID=A0A9P4MP93_9PEZI|nr:putative nucleolar protein 9 [Myriangium duriaei CBS 260.36]